MGRVLEAGTRAADSFRSSEILVIIVDSCDRPSFGVTSKRLRRVLGVPGVVGVPGALIGVWGPSKVVSLQEELELEP